MAATMAVLNTVTVNVKQTSLRAEVDTRYGLL